MAGSCQEAGGWGPPHAEGGCSLCAAGSGLGGDGVHPARVRTTGRPPPQILGARTRVRRGALRLPGQEGEADPQGGPEVLPADHLGAGLLPQPLHLVRAPQPQVPGPPVPSPAGGPTPADPSPIGSFLLGALPPLQKPRLGFVRGPGEQGPSVWWLQVGLGLEQVQRGRMGPQGVKWRLPRAPGAYGVTSEPLPSILRTTQPARRQATSDWLPVTSPCWAAIGPVL